MSFLQLAVNVYKTTPNSPYTAVVEVLDCDKPTNYEALQYQTSFQLTVPKQVPEGLIFAWAVSVLEQVTTNLKFRHAATKLLRDSQVPGQLQLFDDLS